ncbi:MAG: fasciclin domain-containing protein [Rhodospirillaceae bacterium]|nr:fasciclin domain-containing protein [Rhodospirillaceae bacterium]
MMKRLVLVLALLCAPFCAPAHAKDIAGTALDAGTFTIFLAAVKAANLGELLASEGPLTLFAPTDDAFAKLPRGAIQDMLRPENREKTRALLMHHIVAGRVVARDFLGKRMEAATADGALVLIDATKVVMVDGARLIKADVAADNGIIHIIDTVLMPKK